MNSGSMQPPRSYWREIIAALVVKAAALVLLYVLFFASRPEGLPAPDHLFSQPLEEGHSS